MALTFHGSAAKDSSWKREELESGAALERLSSLAGSAAENRVSEREEGEQRKTGRREEGQKDLLQPSLPVWKLYKKVPQKPERETNNITWKLLTLRHGNRN